MALRPRKAHRKVVQAPASDSDSEEGSSAAEESSSRVASSSSKAKGKGKQVESDSESDSPAPVRKVRKTVVKQQQPQKPKQDLSMLFTMPLDILAEVTSHLPPRDLLSLCRISKVFRAFLLSRQSRSVWISSRAQAGFPTLKHIQLSPLQYALNLFGSGLCETCQSTRVDPIYALSIRQCKKCRKEVLVSSNIKRELPDLHPRALECAPHPEVKTYRSAWRVGKVMWRKDHLLEASDKLEELEAEDRKETEARRILELRAAGGGRNTRRANQAVSDGIDVNTPHTDRVGKFVAEKREWAKGCVEEEAKIWKVFDDEQAAQDRAMSEARARERAAELAKQARIRADLHTIGWTQAEIDGWRRFGPGFGHRFGETPKTDKQQWEAARKLINDRLAEEAVRLAKLAEQRALRERQRQRQATLSPYYDALLEAEPEATTNTFPRLGTFLAFPSVKTFWELDDDDEGRTKLSPKSWKKSLKLVKQDIKASVESVRVQTIRTILAATRDVDISTLSNKASKYPATTYDDKFFKKVTSSFICRGWTWNLGAGLYTTSLVHYPEYLSPQSPGYDGVSTTPLRVSTLRAILQAADLDEETATEDDLEKLGTRLRWLEYPVYKKSRATWSWGALVMEVERRKRRKNKSLEVTIVLDKAPDGGAAQQQVESDNEDDVEGEGMEDESEEEEEGEDSEAGSSSGRRRRRQRGDEEEEEDEDVQIEEEGIEMDVDEELEGEGGQLGDEGQGEDDDELDSDEE